MRLRYFGFAFVVMTFGVLASHGAVKTWTGLGGTGNWGTAANWAPAGAPANNDDLIFPAGALFLNNTNTIVGRTFNSISFNGASGGYNLRGNAITLIAGITASHTAGANDVEIAITLGGIQTFGTATAAGTLSVSGNIDLNGARLIVNANTATVTLSGVISGIGTLSKSGAGFLVMSGANANTYSGATTVSVGTLQLSKTVGPAVTGDLTVFSTTTLTAGNQIGDSGDVTLDTATLNLNNISDTIGSLTMIGSTVNTGTGTLTLGGNVTANGSATGSSINGNLHLGSFTRTFNVAQGGAATELTINANIAGGLSGIFPNLIFAGITKTGEGRVVLAGANTFGGTFTINDGFVVADTDTAFGSSGGGVVVNALSALTLSGVHIGNEPLTINVGGFSGGGVSSWSGLITLNTNALLTTGGTLTLSNAISGPGGIRLQGANFEFAGTNSNTYAGLTEVVASVLRLNKTSANAIPGNLVIGEAGSPDNSQVVRNLQSFQIIGDVTVNCSGVLDLNNTSDTIGSLILEGGSVDTGTGTLTVSGQIRVDTGGSGCTLSQIAGRLSVSSGTRSIVFPIGSLALFAPDLEIDATVIGSANIVVSGNSGDLFLNVSNAFTGSFSVSSSSNPGITVHLNHDFSLGATTAGTTVDGRAGLFIEVPANTIREPLTACGVGPNSNGVIQVVGGATWDTNVVLSCDALINTTGSLTIDGTISGAGGFRKIGAGTLTLAGTADNSYTGATAVDTGVLNLGKTSGIAIRNGALTIGDDEGGVNVDQVRYTVAGNQINVTVPITIFGSGILDLNGTSDEIGALTLLGGDVSTGAGTANLGGNVTSLPSTNSLSIFSGRLNLSGPRSFNVTNGTFSPDVRIDSQIVGSGSLIKNGGGELSLNTSNSYSGLTTVNAGFLDVDDSFALGGTASGTVVNQGGSLIVRLNSQVAGEPLTLNGDGASATIGALDGRFGSNSWSGVILINTNSTITVNAAGDFLNLSGAISGADISKEGVGTLIFSGTGANTFNDMRVNAGTLLLAKTVVNATIPNDLYIGDGAGGGNADVVRLSVTSQINGNSAVHIATSGLFDLNDIGESIGALDGFGRVDLGLGGLGTGFNNDSGTYAGLIVGAGGITKSGTGVFVLTANNTYTGTTVVNGGTLAVNGSQPQSDVTVNSAGTLSGGGIVGDISASGNVAPDANPLLGSAPAILTSSNVAFAATGDFRVDLNGPVPDMDHDQLNVRGTNQLGGATLQVTVGPDFAPAEGDRFTIINNDGAENVAGTFAGLPNGSLLTAGGLQFRITYGNDVVLEVTNTALRAIQIAPLANGNGNGIADPNECNLVNIIITNVLGAPVTGISATLVPHTAGVSVTQPFSRYPNMPVGGRASNSTPFQVSLLPGLLCGTNLDFTLILETAANGKFGIPFSLVSGTTAPISVRFNNNSAFAIPDLGTVESPITVSGIATPIRRVSVSLHITHTAASDLDISLLAPDGTIINLSSDNGGTASDYGTDCGDAGRTVFLDTAPTSIAAGTAPFVGNFRPEQVLSSFNGKFGAAVNGTWRLRVTDDAGGAVGTLRCWSLFIFETQCTDGGGACESCPERTILGSISEHSAVQDGRLARDLNPSDCSGIKACPGPNSVGSARFYDAYTFENGETNACITVSLSAECNLFSGAYLDRYEPGALCLNYLADMGDGVIGGETNSYSFRVRARERFVVVVNQVFNTEFCDYRLSVTGGSCRPVLDIERISPSQVLLDWSTAAIGYRLERTNHLASPPSPLWVPVTTVPIISNSRFTVPQPPSGSNQFYRLRQP